MSDKKIYIKNPYARKTSLEQTNKTVQTSGRGSLSNLTKVRILINGNGSVNTNMEKGDITMNITIMNWI